MTWHVVIGVLIKTHETEQFDFRRAIIFASASSDSALHWNNICHLLCNIIPHFPSSFLAPKSLTNLSLSLDLSYFFIYM